MKYELIDAAPARATLSARPKGTKSPLAVAFYVSTKKKLAGVAVNADKAYDGFLTRALASPKFSGKSGQTLTLPAPKGFGADLILLAGIGDEKDINARTYEKLGGSLAQAAEKAGAVSLVVHLDHFLGKKITGGEAAAHTLFGARLGSYRFDKYRTTRKEDEKPTLASITVAGDKKAATKPLAALEALAAGIEFTRDVVSEPANILHPESYAKICEGLSKDGLKVEVLGEKEMKKLGMGSLLGVGQGSARESKLVVLQWNGAGKKSAPIAFVGKGVCFDTGGISIKPAKGMEEMKWDMGGSAAVAGAMKTLALRKAPVNAVGILGLVENMPDGNAQRPGDVVTSMSGQTIEVLNTDAEGRLVLADALWYCQQRFKPHCMIDLATLTGAIIVSLGNEYAGLFASDETLAKRLAEAGEATGEKVWRFPLGDAYDKMLDSAIADMQNISDGRGAGSITAAQFLKRFTNNVPWAHLDIAGTAWEYKGSATTPKGASAFGVRLLDTLVRTHYEG